MNNTTSSFERIQRTKKQPKSSDHHAYHNKRSNSRKQARAHKISQRYSHINLD